MNGILWKWTNYYMGWQPRWFVLKDGILSYYRSEEEVQSGSKGSINLSVCDLNVNSFDNTRFEILIPGEQKYHLKASNIQERQRWVVAIGSWKACHIEPEFEINASSSLSHSLPSNEISSKESEMRLYMELINQQVLLIKNQLSENKCPDIITINDLTSTLNAACDTFLVSLKELISIVALSSIGFVDSPPAYVGSQPFSSLNSINGADYKARKAVNMTSVTRQSIDNDLPRSRTRKSLSQETNLSIDQTFLENRRNSNFFSQMTHSFVDWSKMVETNGKIGTENYINSFWSLLHFMDNFTSSPIVSLKMDIVADVKRLSQKYEADREKFFTLDCIIKSENCNSSIQLNVESATYVIRSLNRCLVFIERFMQYFQDWLKVDTASDYDEASVLKTLITRAYNDTLEAKMNWLNQGLFTIITRSLPSLSEFMCHLLCQCDEIGKSFGDILLSFRYAIDQLLVDMDIYRNSMLEINSHLKQSLSDLRIEL